MAIDGAWLSICQGCDSLVVLAARPHNEEVMAISGVGNSSFQSIASRFLNALNKNQSALAKAFNALSTGQSADIVQRVRSLQAASTESAARISRQTAEQDQAVYRYADASLEGVGNGLSRLRDLAVQASNGTLSDEDRAAIQAEANALSEEINYVANNTEYNGQSLLNGTSSVGNSNITVNATTSGLDLNNLDFTTQEGAEDAIEQIDNAISQNNSYRAQVGAAESAASTRAASAYATEISAAEVRESNSADFADTITQLRQLSTQQALITAAITQFNKSQGQALNSLITNFGKKK